LLVWPHPLVLDYGTGVVRTWQAAALPGLLVLTLLGCAGWLLVRRPRAGFVAAWAFVLLAPSSSFIPLVTQTIAEHRLYLPLAGPVVGFALLLTRWRAPWTVALVFGVAGVMALVTARRALQYRDPVVIWSDTAVHAPNNPRAAHNLGLALQQAEQGAAAETSFARALALDPRYVPARYAWGLALLQRGSAVEAAGQLEAAVQLEPRHADAWLALGNARVQLEQFEPAVSAYETSLRLVDAPDVRHNLVVALVAAGRAAERASDLAGSERAYRQAVAQGPREVEPCRRLGLLHARSGQMEEAERWFRAGLRLVPDDLDLLANLANVLVFAGRAREAIPLYQRVLERRPGDRRTEENLAIARASLR
jgi:tetratricopeptide (TPR) repeat protein